MALLTLYAFVCTKVGLGCSLSKHALDIHEIAAPLSNRDIVLFLLIVTRKFVAYFMLLNLTSIISSVHDSQSDEESRLLSGLSESWGSLISSGSDLVFLYVHVCPVILLTWVVGFTYFACGFVWLKWSIISYAGIVIIIINMP